MGRRWTAGVAALVTVVACTVVGVWTAPSALAADPTIAVAGDIGCGTSDPNYNGGNGTPTACRMKYTSDLLVGGGYSGVLTLGDNMQSDPSPTGFATVFNSTWGRVKSLIHPEAGNHDYGYSGAKGYYGYFGAAAGDPAKGYYSFDIGAWHVVALNSNCTKISGGCGSGGAEDVWLRADLAAHKNQCLLAFDHHARYSSGHDGDNTFMTTLYQRLLDAHADVLLSGHSHDYERFAPQDNAGRLDTANGITQFVVGTGGAFFTGLGTRHPNSVASQNSTFGVLALTLHAASYSWRFVPEAGRTWTDSGSRNCHAAATGTNDFSMTATPSAVSVAPGSQATTQIGTVVAGGSAQPITFSASGLPAGAVASFAPASVTAGSSATMTISTSSGTPTGTSTVVVTGTGTSVAHTVAVPVTVSSGTVGQVALVQSAAATETAAATSLSARFPAATGTGRLLVAEASVYTGLSNRITSVTDSAGNVWARAGTWGVSGHNSDGELWYAANAAPATTVTARTASASVMALRVTEFSGVATTDPLDTVAGTAGTSATPSSGTATPRTSGGLAVGFIAGHGSSGPMTITSAGMVAQPQVTSGSTASVVTAYRVVAGTTPVETAGTFGAAMYWAAGIAVFRPATG